MQRPFVGLFILSLLAVTCFCAALIQANLFNAPELFDIFSYESSFQHKIMLELRLPHVMTAFVVGGLLGLTGCLMQVMLENPLADPFILGISGGASTFTLVGYSLGFEGLRLLNCSFAGAAIAMLLLIMLVGHVGRSKPTKILLQGVMIAAGFGAIISLLLTLLPGSQIKGVLYWLFGDLDNQHYPFLGMIILLAGGSVSLLLHRQLDLLNQGKLIAQTLGINTTRLQTVLFVVSCILTATAVSLAGTIGFVGLIVPHLTRLLLSEKHHVLIPGSILLGGTLLMSADLLASTLIPPEVLPVGIMTTLLGVPVFLYLSRNTHD